MGVEVSKSCLLCILVILVVINSSHGREEIFVKPAKDVTNSSFPCLTLTECTESLESMTTLTLLDGYHKLGSDFLLSNLSNITLRALPGAYVSIDCGGQYQFVFNNVSGLKIENIAFISCGYSLPDSYIPGILAERISDSTLTNITISSGKSPGLYIKHSMMVEITNLLVEKNELEIDHDSAAVVLSEHSLLYFKESVTLSGNLVLLTRQYTDMFTKTIFFSISSTLFFDGVFTVTDNQSPSGIVKIAHSSLDLKGDSIFRGNQVNVYGSLALINTSATITGHTTFFNNSADALSSPVSLVTTAGIFVLSCTVTLNGNITFTNNVAYVASLILFRSTFLISGHLANVDNNAPSVYFNVVQLLSTLQTSPVYSIIGNRLSNSIIRLVESVLTVQGSSEFTGNTRGFPCMVYESNATFNGTNLFEDNSGIVYSASSIVTFEGNSSFLRNNGLNTYAQSGFSILTSDLFFQGSFYFSENNLAFANGGAIRAQSSTITFQGVGVFKDNVARNGGAIYLRDNTAMYLSADTTLTFEGNSADKGGALYMSRINSLCNQRLGFRHLLCFLTFNNNDTLRPLVFLRNRAPQGGSILYLNVFTDFHRFDIPPDYRLPSLFEQGENQAPQIASDSLELDFCDGGISLDNSITKKDPVIIRRGQTFYIGVKAVPFISVGSRYSIRSSFRNMQAGTKSLIGEYQNISITDSCSVLEYRAFSAESYGEIEIRGSDYTCEDNSVFRCLVFNVMFEPCPEGFTLEDSMCICEEMLQGHAVSCIDDTGVVMKLTSDTNLWIGAHRDSNGSFLSSILYEDCPFDYCFSLPANLTLSNPDEQCNNNRSGILCGGCEEDLDLGIGTSRCMDCSNSAYVTMLIPIALLGVLLVAFLFLVQFTVSTGTINGLILYANIVSSERVAFRTTQTTFFGVFIEWLNLDFGIPTCFYDGLNELSYTAWQFAFPLYLWLLVAFIIILTHYSIRASKFFGKSDPVAVLATVVLLSYNKLLRNIRTIFSPAHLQYAPNSTNVTTPVWLYDGNVPFGHGGHAVLIAVAFFILLFLFLPYTLVLLFGQCLQKIEIVSRCFNKLNLTYPINSYQTPYKSASRYWVGLCLLLRCIMAITFALVDGLSNRYLTFITVSILLLSIIGASGGIYSNRWLDILEISFIVNFGVFSAATSYVTRQSSSIQSYEGTSQLVLSYISTSIAFVTFVIVTVVLICRRLSKLYYVKEKFTFLKEKLIKRLRINVGNPRDRDEMVEVDFSMSYSPTVDSEPFTKQEVRLYRNSRLRETLLEDSSEII